LILSFSALFYLSIHKFYAGHVAVHDFATIAGGMQAVGVCAGWHCVVAPKCHQRQDKSGKYSAMMPVMFMLVCFMF